MLVLHSYTMVLTFFCLFIPLKATKNLKKKTVGLRGVIIDSAVSLTPWRRSPRCHWHLWGGLRGVNDTLEAVSTVSLTPRRPPPKCQWNHGDWHKFFIIRSPRCQWRLRGVIDTAETASEVSLTPRRPPQRCHWHRGDCLRGVIDTAEAIKTSNISTNSYLYSKVF